MREIKFQAAYLGKIYDVVEWAFEGKQDIFVLNQKNGTRKLLEARCE